MWSRNSYVPILKTKHAEFKALAAVTPLVKFMVAPLLEVTPIRLNFQTNMPSVFITEHLDAICDALSECWSDRVFLDGLWVEDELSQSGTGREFDRFMQKLRAKNVDAVPVTGPKRSRAYQRGVQAILRRDKQGVCVRLRREEFANDSLNGVVTALLDNLSVAPAEVDLVLDFGCVIGEPSARLADEAYQIIADLPNARKFRRLVFAATSFPENLGQLPRNAWSELERIELQAFRQILARRPPLDRLPAFGDYAIANACLPPEMDPRKLKTPVQLRWSAPHNWCHLI